jgi:hypothetical protein
MPRHRRQTGRWRNQREAGVAFLHISSVDETRLGRIPGSDRGELKLLGGAVPRRPRARNDPGSCPEEPQTSDPLRVPRRATPPAYGMCRERSARTRPVSETDAPVTRTGIVARLVSRPSSGIQASRRTPAKPSQARAHAASRPTPFANAATQAGHHGAFPDSLTTPSRVSALDHPRSVRRALDHDRGSCPTGGSSRA